MLREIIWQCSNGREPISKMPPSTAIAPSGEISTARNYKSDPQERGTHTFTWGWSQKLQLPIKLNPGFFLVGPEPLLLYQFQIFDCSIHDCVSCNSLLTLNKPISKEKRAKIMPLDCIPLSIHWLIQSEWLLGDIVYRDTEMGWMKTTGIQERIWLLKKRAAPKWSCLLADALSRAVNVGQLAFALRCIPHKKNWETSFCARGEAAWRCLRINGVVEDSGESVIDVADHVVQLVLCL